MIAITNALDWIFHNALIIMGFFSSLEKYVIMYFPACDANYVCHRGYQGILVGNRQCIHFHQVSYFLVYFSIFR